MSIYLATFGKLRYLGLAEISEPLPAENRWIVIKTLRGLEMGLLGGPLSQEQQAKYRAACLEDSREEQSRGPEPMLQEVEFLGVADEARVEAYYQIRAEEEAVLVRARSLLTVHQLQMKLVDVEYMLDRKKLFFYFTSEHRIDFRTYVRDLAREFKTRIEMRQIGVRDEARAVRGVAPCGRPCCCSYWLHRFTPICIRMVKEQNLALNPAKISGICGRLMCCMAYEHPVYSELWRSLPSPGSKIKTERGNYVLEGVDLRTECVRVRFPSGREIPVAIAEFPDFKEVVLRGESWETEEEVIRRAPPPRRKAAPAKSARSSGAEKAEPPREAGRRIKPEKISLEEHLASRPPSEQPSSEGASPASSQGASPQGGAEGGAPKKRSRRRRSGGGAARERADPGAKAQTPQKKEPQGSERNAQPKHPPHPPRQERPERSEDPAKEGTSQPAGGSKPRRNKRRSEGRPPEGREGERRERPRRPEGPRRPRSEERSSDRPAEAGKNSAPGDETKGER